MVRENLGIYSSSLTAHQHHLPINCSSGWRLAETRTIVWYCNDDDSWPAFNCDLGLSDPLGSVNEEWPRNCSNALHHFESSLPYSDVSAYMYTKLKESYTATLVLSPLMAIGQKTRLAFYLASEPKQGYQNRKVKSNNGIGCNLSILLISNERTAPVTAENAVHDGGVAAFCVSLCRLSPGWGKRQSL